MPPLSWIEAIPVTALPDQQALISAIDRATEGPTSQVFAYLNVHVANQAHQHPDLKAYLQRADLVFCDGAGIQLASRLLGQPPIPTRLTGADWWVPMLSALHRKRLFFVGGAPGVAEKAFANIAATQTHAMPTLAWHHGYFKDAAPVLAHIADFQPDLLCVGMGTPVQERWVARYQHALTEVPLIMTVGAVLDYFADVIPRCPAWMGEYGLEWLYRLTAEPSRLFGRYVVGNPAFLARIARQRLMASVRQPDTAT
jgi:N-acetylglucosaminyldiphosphoundecaprenol N-acetyl-beta-D-mannosaminyltransferase